MLLSIVLLAPFFLLFPSSSPPKPRRGSPPRASPSQRTTPPIPSCPRWRRIEGLRVTGSCTGRRPSPGGVAPSKALGRGAGFLCAYLQLWVSGTFLSPFSSVCSFCFVFLFPRFALEIDFVGHVYFRVLRARFFFHAVVFISLSEEIAMKALLLCLGFSTRRVRMNGWVLPESLGLGTTHVCFLPLRLSFGVLLF